MKILVINGPNLNFLGIREKGVYGTQNYDDLLKMISDKAKELGATAEVFQSNHEGAIIAMRSGMHLPVLPCRRWRSIFRILHNARNSAKFP